MLHCFLNGFHVVVAALGVGAFLELAVGGVVTSCAIETIGEGAGAAEAISVKVATGLGATSIGADRARATVLPSPDD